MAKGIGLIGNFRGKVGNMVGYNLKDSNNKQTQGVRVYQPIVKNPKTAAQAEQRAKLLAVNATYRALKMIIDRGNESLPYGNKSRLAWLKTALKAEVMPWYVKGAIVEMPVGCQVTKGSLALGAVVASEDNMKVLVPGLATAASYATVGALATALIATDTYFKAGDQLTIVVCNSSMSGILTNVISIVLDTTSTEEISGFQGGNGELIYEPSDGLTFGTFILSREGINGEHLRSNSSLAAFSGVTTDTPYNAASKAAAIASYRASDATSSDWAEESIQ